MEEIADVLPSLNLVCPFSFSPFLCSISSLYPSLPSSMNNKKVGESDNIIYFRTGLINWTTTMKANGRKMYTFPALCLLSY